MSHPNEANKHLSTSASNLRSTRIITSVTSAELSRPHSAGSSSSSASSKCRPGSGSTPRSAPGSAGSRSCGSAGSTGSRKVSDRLNPKTVDHFSPSTKSLSSFATLYNNGSIPCRAFSLSLLFQVSSMPINLYLSAPCFGIHETVHPYTFIARQGFKELLATSGAETKVISIIPKLILPIRTALGHSDVTVFEAGLEALTQLSTVAGMAVNPHLKSLMVSIAKHSMDKKYKKQITDSLQELEINGGKEALLQIKARIPTYQSVCS
ncbi:hypothetical protein LSH36_127g07042 [Paralvinella palmiformis]|uniref:PACRG-like protein n=1 Tax=Paralvinella palmiformis TaxID=53620 RepID=A0AAD9N8H3_9ANNE|nr:hypothetical protein LSH36_127g07042 [Paralvinella palmiformis]